jgi:hypothetical protein
VSPERHSRTVRRGQPASAPSSPPNVEKVRPARWYRPSAATPGSWRGHRALVVLSAAFALVQTTLPIVVWVRGGSGPRDFSWDMFSHYLECRRFEAQAERSTDGAAVDVQLGRDFTSWAQLSRMLVPGRLESYAVRLCAQLRSEARDDVRLRWLTECRSARGAEWTPVLDSTRDYCRARP